MKSVQGGVLRVWGFFVNSFSFLSARSQGLKFVTGTCGVHFTPFNLQVADGGGGGQGEVRFEGVTSACCAQCMFLSLSALIAIGAFTEL